MKKNLSRLLAFVLVVLMVIMACPKCSYAKSTTAVTISTQDELKSALSDKAIKKITIKTNKELAFTIKSGIGNRSFRCIDYQRNFCIFAGLNCKCKFLVCLYGDFLNRFV